MSIELKVKAKSLAAEAKIIRQEEAIALKEGYTFTYQRLHRHRVVVVRPEARYTHLARGFIKGTPYRTIETTTRTEPEIRRIQKLVERYSARHAFKPNRSDTIKKEIAQWLRHEPLD